MDLQSEWPKIRRHFNRSFRSSFHVSIGSVDADSNPTVTPIGSLFLNENLTGFYFEKYPSKLPEHSNDNRNVCVLAVNSSLWFWIKSLYRGRFKIHPAIKLYGKLGERREATGIEISRLNRRMRATRGLRGNKYLWGDMKYIREITFSKGEKINLGEMTKQL